MHTKTNPQKKIQKNSKEIIEKKQPTKQPSNQTNKQKWL
jgi:hypothetical protein